MMNSQRRTITRAGLALLTVVCLLLTAVAPALAATVSVGSTGSSLTPSDTKVYIKLSRSVLFFKGDTYGTGATITPTVGAVCQLVTDDFYTASDGLTYFGVYYMSDRYNVLRTDVINDIMSAADLESYITGTVWKQTTFTTLKEPLNLVGDIRVHALQLALQRLGYYTDKLDGNYGENTTAAVKKFQRANGLHADGAAGVLTQPVIYTLASGGSVTPGGSSSGGSSSGSGSSGSSSGSSSSVAGTLKTKVSVNLRKSTSTSSARLAVLPKGLNLAYIGTSVKNGVTWYNVRYNSITGWVMGTYVTASGSSSSGGGSGSSSTTPIGTVTITMPSTRVRKTPGGTKTGTVLAKGTVVNLLAEGVQSGGYTWYNIRTSSGLVGYVRGDCATVNSSSGGSGGGDVPVSTEKTFVRLPANTVLFTTKTRPTSGGYTVSAGTVLQMVTTATYTEGGVEYCTLYYNNQQYNAVYADVKAGIMTSSDLSAYVQVLWQSSLGTSLKRELNLVGDIRVYALQAALNKLGYYTGKLDGTYGTETQSAVRNFQRKAGISVDGACGTATWAKLQAQLGTSGGSGGSGGGVVVTDFGTVNSVQKASWDYGDNGGALFPKSTYATVMDVETGKVFRIYRWSGGNHADCVPATANDTRTMCEIVGFPYNSSRPTSDQLAKIKADGNASTVTYTWPDFKNSFGGAKNIGSAWDRRPALLNVNGTVYAVSIYGFPHGFNGTDSFSNSKFSDNGQYFYANNNYYGMMCVHFVGSKTHGGSTPDSRHQAAIDKAYDYAKKLWPTLCK